MRRLLVLAAAALGLAACNTAGPAPQASSAPPQSAYAGLPAGVSPPGFRLPEGSGCSGAVARWKAIQDNDLASGHVGQKVYDTIQGEIAQASATCQAGKEGESVALVRASRARHGYPEG